MAPTSPELRLPLVSDDPPAEGDETWYLRFLDKEGNLRAFKLKRVRESETTIGSEQNKQTGQEDSVFESFNQPMESIEVLDASDKLKTSIDLFDEWDIIEKIRDKKSNEDFYIINEAFRDAIVKKQNKDNTAKQNVIKLSAVTLILLLGIAGWLIIVKIHQHKIDRDNVFLSQHVSLFNPPTGGLIDTNRALRKLILLSDIYKNIETDTTNISFAKRIFLDFFNSYDFLGKKISVPDLYPKSVSINGKNDVLVIYTNLKPSDRSDLQNEVDYAYLYNSKGTFITKYQNVLDAGFGNKSELIVLKKDSLIRYSNGTQVIFHLNSVDELVSSINNASITSISSDTVYCQISSYVSKQLSRRSSNNNMFQPTLFALIDPRGNVRVLPFQYYGMKKAGDNIPSKKMRLSYHDSSISFINGNQTKHTTVDFHIVEAFISSSGDHIFASDGQYLTVLDTDLVKHSKFKKNLQSKNGPLSISNLVAYSQPGYVVLVNLDNSSVKTVNTLDPNSIIKYVDTKRHAKSWPSLSDDDKMKSFGYHNP